jgi:hypothetical protein
MTSYNCHIISRHVLSEVHYEEQAKVFNRFGSLAVGLNGLWACCTISSHAQLCYARSDLDCHFFGVGDTCNANPVVGY